MLGPLVPYLDSAGQPMTLTHLTRYLLPMLFKIRPSSAKTLLQILENAIPVPAFSNGNNNCIKHGFDDAAFVSWVSIASLAVSLGQIDISNLPRGVVEEAISHAEPDVRLRSFQLLAGSKDLLQPQTMDLIKQSLLWNSVLPSAGYLPAASQVI